MWVDERGSDVLGEAECRQLLAIGAARHLPGHLGLPGDGAPIVLPVDYTVDGTDVVVRVGEGLFDKMVGRLVAFEVEGADEERPWSVLLRGLALQDQEERLPGPLPRPRVAHPGKKLIRIRSDVMTGRRLGRRRGDPGHP